MSKSINTRYSEIIAKHRQQDPVPNNLERTEASTAARPTREVLKKAAKSKDPNYVKLTLYVQLDTLTAAKIKALQQRKDLSDVADELLRAWAHG